MSYAPRSWHRPLGLGVCAITMTGLMGRDVDSVPFSEPTAFDVPFVSAPSAAFYYVRRPLAQTDRFLLLIRPSIPGLGQNGGSEAEKEKRTAVAWCSQPSSCQQPACAFVL